MNHSSEDDKFKPGPTDLKDIVAIRELRIRPSKPVNYQIEAEALRELAEVLTADPDSIMQKLVEVARRSVGCHSAGISVLEPEAEIFRWRAVDGPLKKFIGATLPRDFSPCGEVLDQTQPLLMLQPERHYPYITELGLSIDEVLLIPFSQDGKLVGTLWAVYHSPDLHFDLEDLRLLTSLSHFAGAALLSSTAKKQAEEARAAVDFAHSQLRDLQTRFQRSAAATNLGVWYCDLPFNVLNWSQETKAHFFMAPDAIVTIQDFYNHMHPEDRERTRLAIETSISNRSPYDIHYRTVDPTDPTRTNWVRAVGWTDYDANGKPIRFDGITLDVTKERLREQELKTAKDEAELANTLKSAFLANMSHEIRTPLGAMIGFADLLTDPELTPEERRSYVEILIRNGESLGIIINDILDLSKVEAGFLILEFEEIDPDQAVADVFSLLNVKAREKSLTLEMKSENPAPVVTDPVRLKQILMNLVGNAIKFTKTGGINVRSYRETSDGGEDFLCFEIRDTGIGIPESQQQKIFEMFVQADGSMARKFGGTGLGLALSRRLARALGGDVTVKSSTPGEGSTFLVRVENRPHLKSTETTVGQQIETRLSH